MNHGNKYKNLPEFISALESAGELTRVKGFVSPHLEITEITDRISKNNGNALLFENNGTDFPLLINAYGSGKRICMALGVEHLDDIGNSLEQIIRTFLRPKTGFLNRIKIIPRLREFSSWMPGRKHGKGACQEVVMNPPDLTRLPVLTCWPGDGGPFITLPSVHTVDPESGIRNVGMYRMQVFGPSLTGMHWHLHKGSAHHFRKYRTLGRKMPVSVTLGGDPVYTYAATAPLPENLDEYLLAGFLRKKRVELVRCLTNDLEVPSDVDFVIEGYVDPEEEFILEGPFGDHTGFYSLADHFPRFHVTCITHCKNAVYPATIVGIPPQEDGWIGKATERIFLTPVRMTVAPEIVDMHMPVEGVFHNIILVSIRKEFPGQAGKVMNALWGAGQMMFNKVLAVFDENVNLTDYRELARIISVNVDIVEDIRFVKGPVDILDHSSREYASGSKMGIDATTKSRSDQSHSDLQHPGETDKAELLRMFPGITWINDSLLSDHISVVILGISKTEKNQCRNLAESMIKRNLIRNIKCAVFLDDQVLPDQLSDIVWIAASNIDPLRDCFHLSETDRSLPILFIDATRKTADLDGFSRDWPNVVTMDDETIRKMDMRWSELIPGPFLESPSNKYKRLVINSGPKA